MMPHKFRIGTQVWPADPFWVQVQAAIEQRAEELAVELVPIVVENPAMSSDEEIERLVEEVLAQDLDALIGWNLSNRLARRILESGLAIVDLTETDLRHSRLVSPLGLYAIARQIGAYLADRLSNQGTVVSVGGAPGEEHGRLVGVRDALGPYPGLRLAHVPSPWRYEHAY